MLAVTPNWIRWLTFAAVRVCWAERDEMVAEYVPVTVVAALAGGHYRGSRMCTRVLVPLGPVRVSTRSQS